MIISRNMGKMVVCSIMYRVRFKDSRPCGLKRHNSSKSIGKFPSADLVF